jgi:S-adenosylmethionine:tRNA ribosyltransferase-isomerase
LKTSDFSFDLPPNLIAQQPTEIRDASRLLVANRACGQYSHHYFRDLTQLLKKGDVLILNDSRVLPARIRGSKIGGSAKVELLLSEPTASQTWWALLKPGKRLPVGSKIAIKNRNGEPTSLTAEILEKNEEGHAHVRFEGTNNFLSDLGNIGEMPLPPYIQRDSYSQNKEDTERYQTVYAKPAGSIAAPTAGLHFTKTLLDQLRVTGVEIHTLTLHVGLGTFAPVKSNEIHGHELHTESFELSASTAKAINQAKAEGRRIVAVGTTSVRALETVALTSPSLTATTGTTNIFIYPPREFKVVDALITNFHLPQSTLLMLISAFSAPGQLNGREWIINIYEEAIREKYRFFSYGDAMLIL